MNRITAILSAITLALSACAYDPGGSVADRARSIATEPPQSITGYCASACTMQLRRNCVDPSAVLTFHGPKSPKPWVGDQYSQWVQFIAKYYPPEIAAWYLSSGHKGTTVMSGAEAIEMGARPCKSKQ